MGDVLGEEIERQPGFEPRRGGGRRRAVPLERRGEKVAPADGYRVAAPARGGGARVARVQVRIRHAHRVEEQRRRDIAVRRERV